MKSPVMDEVEFRARIQAVLSQVEKAFAEVDPDLAECEQQFGALTIKFPDGSRCILSSQPSVRQLWMAVASKGLAFHFNFDPAASNWKDDKGQQIEVLSYLKSYLKEKTGLDFAIGG